MKIKPVNYMHGGLSLELIAETPIETALLREIFEHGEMSRGNGESKTHDNMSCGFYLAMTKREGVKT